MENAGIDVESALERLLGNEGLLERLLGKFLDDPQYSILCAALECGDMDRAVTAAHTLKGVCGNLSMTKLFQLFSKQVDALRAGDLALARNLMEQIGPAYDQVAAAIRRETDEAG